MKRLRNNGDTASASSFMRQTTDTTFHVSAGWGYFSPPTETLLDVKSWTCCLPHERTGRDGVTKVHLASTTITRVIWKTCIEYYLYKATLINWVESCSGLNYIRMTQLLTHSVAHSTRPSSRSKTNNQSLKKFLSLAVSWVKVVKNGKILTFKVNFLSQKLSESV